MMMKEGIIAEIKRLELETLYGRIPSQRKRLTELKESLIWQELREKIEALELEDEDWHLAAIGREEYNFFDSIIQKIHLFILKILKK